MHVDTRPRGMDGELRGTILRTAAYLRRLGTDGEMCRACLRRVVLRARPQMTRREADAALWFVLRE